MDELKMQTLLVGLTDLGITALNVYYEGGGDSGAIERIVYSKDPDMTWEDIHDIDVWGQNQLEELGASLYGDLEDFAQDPILDNIENWWDDEGGFGYLCIKVPSGEYKIFNSIYIKHTEDFEYDGNLIDKSLE